MERFWRLVDRAWLALASVKLTMVIFIGLLLLSIPGTVILQKNISNVDPALQYSYEFWKFAKVTQLFTSYHSIWYVALVALLAVNLIACSVERWPGMWKAATAKARALSQAAFDQRKSEYKHEWETSLSQEEFKSKAFKFLNSRWLQPQVLLDSENELQIFWQTGRWSRIANYVVHTSLLVIFAGAIITALYGFEGAANIPEKRALDTFFLFKEGARSGLKDYPGTLSNEKLMPFRVEAEYFNVEFYEKFPGRPKDFRTKLNVLERPSGRLLASKVITVNDPLEFCWRKRMGVCLNEFVFYQASYGPMGDYEFDFRVFDRSKPQLSHQYRARLNEPIEINEYGVTVVPIRAHTNVQDLGPGVQLQEIQNDVPVGEPFWLLSDYPAFDFERRQENYFMVADKIKPLYFTGLQIGSDPGAPIYWIGSLFMLLGTFYALFVQHKKYHLRFKEGQVLFSGSIHRLPLSFVSQLTRINEKLKKELS